MHRLNICLALLVVSVALFAFTVMRAKESFGPHSLKEVLRAHKPRVYYHYVDWCPGCKMMQPVWAGAKAAIGDRFDYVEINEEVTKSPWVTKYPTIVMTINNKSYEYKGPADHTALVTWILAPSKAT